MEIFIKTFVLVMLISSIVRIIGSIVAGIKHMYLEENLD